MDTFLFDDQFHTFQTYGYSMEPSGEGFVGNAAALTEMVLPELATAEQQDAPARHHSSSSSSLVVGLEGGVLSSAFGLPPSCRPQSAQASLLQRHALQS